VNSAIYRGRVRHRRFLPREHSFQYRVFMLYIDLDELPHLFDCSRAWSAEGRALARFRREDFMGDPSVPLDEAVRERVRQETGVAPRGPVRLLTNLRYFGFIINPISCYYCFAEDGETLEYVVAEVTNTPWNERHCYVIPADQKTAKGTVRRTFEKDFHVSPFQSMDMVYNWRNNTPGSKLAVNMRNTESGETVFDAMLCLERQPISGRNLNRLLWQFPLMTARVGLAIYWQALRLWLKSVPFHSHPKYQTASTTHE
jgi:DUF1365 family protein